MNINGIDVDALTPDACDSFPNVVPGRVLQLDGDMLVYQCSYDDNASLESCINSYFSSVEYRRKMTGSEHVNIHLTAGDKGGRFKIATLKEYQITRRLNRAKTVPPVNLQPLKDHLYYCVRASVCGLNPVHKIYVHSDQEADDGMAQGNFDAKDNPELSVIMSGDKDLCMCSGWHADWNSFNITLVDGYGSIHLDDSGSQKKIKGFGTSFFWAQLLMGDAADSIPGVVKVGHELLNEVDPTAKVTADLEILRTHTEDSTKYKAALKRCTSRKPKKCGAVLAYNILKNCKTDREAFEMCVRAYRSHYGEGYSYTTWDGYDVTKSSGEMLLEQAELLWMRRVKDESARAFFKDVIEERGWYEEGRA